MSRLASPLAALNAWAGYKRGIEKKLIEELWLFAPKFQRNGLQIHVFPNDFLGNELVDVGW